MRLPPIVVSVVLAGGIVVTTAGPASAHTVSGIGATNWITTLVSVRPAVAGLTVRVVELGSRLELDNRGPEVTVLGYDGEPYLRVGPHGVFQNLNSPATYLNRTRTGTTPIPPGLPTDRNAAPRWQKISAGHVARWHDHRTHWMGASPPPDVRRTPDQVHLQPPWRVYLRQGDTPIVVTGELTWVPGPSPWPWLAGAATLAVGCALLGRLRRYRWPLAAALAILLAVDIVHSVGIAMVASGDLGYRLVKFVSGSYYSFIGWTLGLVGVRLLIRDNIDGLYAMVFAAASAFLFSGLLDLTTLHRSHAPFVAGVGWDRVTVIIALGAGLGLAGTGIRAVHRQAPDLGPAEDETG